VVLTESDDSRFELQRSMNSSKGTIPARNVISNEH
jgi:hypothetical protein